MIYSEPFDWPEILGHRGADGAAASQDPLLEQQLHDPFMGCLQLGRVDPLEYSQTEADSVGLSIRNFPPGDSIQRTSRQLSCPRCCRATARLDPGRWAVELWPELMVCLFQESSSRTKPPFQFLGYSLGLRNYPCPDLLNHFKAHPLEYLHKSYRPPPVYGCHPHNVGQFPILLYVRKFLNVSRLASFSFSCSMLRIKLDLLPW